VDRNSARRRFTANPLGQLLGLLAHCRKPSRLSGLAVALRSAE
jgi:hypothetical protein